MVGAIGAAELRRLGVWTYDQMSSSAAYRLADDFD